MKKHYITPVIKNVTVGPSQSLLAGSIYGGIGNDNTGTQGTNGYRGRRGVWGNLWDDGAEWDASTEE